jgi:hypothetical protein
MLNSPPFILCAEHWQTKLTKILRDFFPANTAVDLRKVMLTEESKTKGSSALFLFINFAFYSEQPVEYVLTLQISSPSLGED